MSLPPEWPFRCPGEGWYLSRVAAEIDEDGILVRVTGYCKRHELVTVTDPRAYAKHLWEENDEPGERS